MRAPLLAASLLTASLAASLVPALASTALADEKRELDSHTHGHVELKVAVEGDTLEIALEAPGESIVGFEHEARTDEQKTAVEAARKQLGDAAAIFALPDTAGCEVKSSNVELHIEGEHSGFEASYSYSCATPASLTSLETKLFTLYPAIEEIEVEYATPAGQGTGEMEPGNAKLDLPATS